MLALYGHPFSSYTWKAQIALYANATPFEFRMLDGDHPQHEEFVGAASPLGKFPVLTDGTTTVSEATAIIEYLQAFHPGPAALIPADPRAAVTVRMLDRVFDNYVMTPLQEIVGAALRDPGRPDPGVTGRARDGLDQAYRWLEDWLAHEPPGDAITLVECAAAPALFYADWAHPIPLEHDRLRQWRAHLLKLPPIARCVEDARPYRAYFPLGAPNRD